MAYVPPPSPDTSLAMRLCFVGALLVVLAALLTFAAVAARGRPQAPR